MKTIPKFNELLKKIRELRAIQHTSFIKIAVLRNSTIERFSPFLEYLLLEEGICPKFFFSEYDNYYQEILDTNSNLKKFSPDIIFLSFDTRVELKVFFDKFSSMNKDAASSIIEEKKEKIKSILEIVKTEYAIPVILNGFETPCYPSLSLFDSQNISGQVNLVRKLNMDLVILSNTFDGVYFLDLDLIINRAGGNKAIDKRFWFIEKNPYTHSALAEIAKEYSAFILTLKGKVKKCLVVDADNTLWGGIVGEDGFNGIRLGLDYPGSAFIDFQKFILSLFERGVILCICSKNNECDVVNVLRNHPDMLLKENHFSLLKINWENKAQNIREISQELNIGLDSIVFVDDNPFEIGLVRTELPKVTSILLTSENPTEYRSSIEKLNIFNSLSFSQEDKLRSSMYIQDIKRKKEKLQFLNIDEYLNSLKMKATFFRNNAFTYQRVSQLSQRTNQFNLTSIRYNEEDIKKLSSDKNTDIIALKLEDRFGEFGIIGAAILRYSLNQAFIESFMISCRALGRNVEFQLLIYIYEIVGKRGIQIINAEMRPTNKNTQVHKFYAEKMFCVTEEDKFSTKYEIRIDQALSQPRLEYIEIFED